VGLKESYSKVTSVSESDVTLEGKLQLTSDYQHANHLAVLALPFESGKRASRPQLDAAIAACKKHKAKLIVAKLGRASHLPPSPFKSS
jgi:hypothetical protein